VNPPKVLSGWWAEHYRPSVAKTPERRKSFTTSSGAVLEPVYAGPPDDDLPGAFPFTRGIHPTMYCSRFWTMRQYAGFGDAAESNRRYRYLLDQGQTGLSIAFDLPTQMGYDADHPQAKGEVGRVGVHVGTLEDMATLFDGIPLGEVSTSMTVNSTAPVLMAFYAAVARSQGASLDSLQGTIQNDILKEYVARGTYIYPIEHGMRLCVDTIEHCTRHMPKWNTISISGYHIREAGADAVQELAFTFANAEAYVRALLDRGEAARLAPSVLLRAVLQDRMFAPADSWTLPAHLFLVSGWSALCTDPNDPNHPDPLQPIKNLPWWVWAVATAALAGAALAIWQ